MTQTITAYKLMSKNMTTNVGYQWVMGEWRKTSGKGELCGSGWFHAYATPTIAVFHNSIHARMNLSESILVEVECRGEFRDGRGLECGYTEMCPIREVPFIIPTIEQHIRYGIYCAVWVDRREEFLVWARNWLSGKDRSVPPSAWAAQVARAAAARAAADLTADYPWEEFALAALNDAIPASLQSILNEET